MKHNMNKIRKNIISAIILIMCVTIVSATPPISESYWGYATLNGAPAPYGTSITAEVYGTGEVVGSTTIQDPNGGYSLDVKFDDSDTPEDEGANEGDQLTWKINGIECSTPTPGADIAKSGGLNSNFNIVATSADTPLSATVLHPNGGESIPIGTQVQVSAHATDGAAVTSVTFSYSNNSGSDWNSIGAGTRVSGTDKDGIWNRTWNTNSLGAGSNYLIRAVADGGTSTREDQSDSTFSLTTCTPPSTPTLNDPGTTDTDGSYTVAWSSVSGATSYTLEEDTSGSFGSPTVVYSGSGTSTQITGRSNGTYYYRVNACNACGCSGWSDVGAIVVESSTTIVWNGSVSLGSGTFVTTADNSGEEYAISHRCALAALVRAAEKGGFDYTIDDSFYESYGALYTDTIGGFSDCMYWVNYPDDPMPMVGANEFELNDGDLVTWYHSGGMDSAPNNTNTLVQISISIIEPGDVNRDGTLTPADATIALRLAASGGWDPAADMNSDDRITSLDALTILMMARTRVCVNAPEVISGALTATIDVEDVLDMNSGQFDISFDSSVVNVTAVAGGDIGGTAIPIVDWRFMDADTIRVRFKLSGGDGVSGTGYVAMIDFVVTGSQGEACVLDTSNGLLVDTSAEEIPSIWIDDEITI